MNTNKIEIYQTEDGKIQLDVRLENETVWLSQAQMAELFQTDRTSIVRHINNIYKVEELQRESTCAKIAQVQIEGNRKVSRNIPYFNLDMIISVGYRVNAKRGVKFRQWANQIIKDYLLKGYAVNDKRTAQLGQVIQILKRAEHVLDSKQVLSVVEKYNTALDLLDSYDHQTMQRPKGNKSVYVLTYEECMSVIESMRFGDESSLFGKEKDDSFKGSIGNIYQSFGGNDVYPSLEEKAANLLYFVTKNHSFIDGNKRIAATMFLYFLDKNGALFIDGEKMIAESRSEEKEMMISVIMNCIGK